MQGISRALQEGWSKTQDSSSLTQRLALTSLINGGENPIEKLFMIARKHSCDVDVMCPLLLRSSNIVKTLKTDVRGQQDVLQPGVVTVDGVGMVCKARFEAIRLTESSSGSFTAQ